jgi:hypothetical protein
MPVTNSSIYPTAEAVANQTRLLVQDVYNNGNGRIFTDNNPQTVRCINAAIDRVQFELANNGVESYWRDNLILSAVPAVQNPSPATQVYIGFAGTTITDGSVSSPTPMLPSDLFVPWDLWERPTGSAIGFQKMHKPDVALPSVYQTAYLNLWEWRGDAIWLIGATQTMDLRLRYEAVIPDILPANQIDWNTTTIPILNGLGPLAFRAAYFYNLARGDQDGMAAMDMQANIELKKLVDAATRGKQRQSVRRRGFPHGRGIGNGMFGLY